MCVCEYTQTQRWWIQKVRKLEIQQAPGSLLWLQLQSQYILGKSGDYIWGTPTGWEEQSYKSGSSSQMADKQEEDCIQMMALISLSAP